jgi:hypothetical protein
MGEDYRGYSHRTSPDDSHLVVCISRFGTVASDSAQSPVPARTLPACEVISLDSKWKHGSAPARSAVEDFLHSLYLQGQMNDEQMALVAQRFPGFRLPKAAQNSPSVIPFQTGRRG